MTVTSTGGFTYTPSPTAQHSAAGGGPSTDTDRLLNALRQHDPQVLASALTNDMQPAAISLRPELGDLLADGLSYGALAGIVSGSGPTVAFLAADHERAIDLAVALTASGTVTDAHRATGPVHGATLRGVPRVD